MSGYRAAPEASYKSIVQCHGVEWTREHDRWRGDAGHGKARIARDDHKRSLDALYHARADAPDEEINAIDSMYEPDHEDSHEAAHNRGIKSAADALRRMKGSK